MNFFEHQDQARRSTQQLLMLFVLAVAAMIVAFYLAAIAIVRLPLWSPHVLCAIALVTLITIGLGSLTKMASLRQGGQVVAIDLGGTLVLPETTDPQEQMLLNVVEEMAIAAGIPVPSVYLLRREPGINAFAAGHTVNDAVIGVTQGCLQELSREELQGVIAHEFSHILHGDMGLNLKLMGVLHGILIIYIFGRILLRVRSGSSRSSGGIMLMGLAVMLIGSIGLLMGRLIKSAISRQREFLADASAVQFTRNPQGIGNALLKIGGSTAHSRLRSPQAEAASHMFFSNALERFSFTNLLATHPPIEVRVQRLGALPGSNLGYRRRVRPPSSRTGIAQTAMTQSAVASGAVIGLHQGNSAQPSNSDSVQISSDQVVAQVGKTDSAHLAYAHTLLEKLPSDLREALKHKELSAAVVYALLLDDKVAIREQQLQHLGQTETPEMVEATTKFKVAIAQLDPRTRLPLLDLTIPALRQSSDQEWHQLCQQVQQLIEADSHLSLSEYVLQRILEQRLRPHFGSVPDNSVLYTTLDQLWSDCVTLLSQMAQVGHDTPDARVYAMRCGLFRLPGAKQHSIPESLKPSNFQQLDGSLKRLARATPQLKKALVDACSHTVLLDNTVTVEEAELLRAIVIGLDCPIPPFLKAAGR